MLDSSLIGARVGPFKVTLTRECTSEYAKSIHLLHPVYHDINKARALGYEDLLVPTTFPVTLWNLRFPWWLSKDEHWIHGEQRFYYSSPLTANTTLNCSIELRKVEWKQGSKGKMQVLTHELCGHTDHKEFTSVSILLRMGKRG